MLVENARRLAHGYRNFDNSTKVKRAGHSFRNFHNYRLRLLLPSISTGAPVTWGRLPPRPRSEDANPLIGVELKKASDTSRPMNASTPTDRSRGLTTTQPRSDRTGGRPLLVSDALRALLAASPLPAA